MKATEQRTLKRVTANGRRVRQEQSRDLEPPSLRVEATQSATRGHLCIRSHIAAPCDQPSGASAHQPDLQHSLQHPRRLPADHAVLFLLEPLSPHLLIHGKSTAPLADFTKSAPPETRQLLPVPTSHMARNNVLP